MGKGKKKGQIWVECEKERGLSEREDGMNRRTKLYMYNTNTHTHTRTHTHKHLPTAT